MKIKSAIKQLLVSAGFKRKVPSFLRELLKAMQNDGSYLDLAEMSDFSKEDIDWLDADTVFIRSLSYAAYVIRSDEYDAVKKAEASEVIQTISNLYINEGSQRMGQLQRACAGASSADKAVAESLNDEAFYQKTGIRKPCEGWLELRGASYLAAAFSGWKLAAH